MKCYVLGYGDEYWFEVKKVYFDKEKVEKDCKTLNNILSGDHYSIQDSELDETVILNRALIMG